MSVVAPLLAVLVTALGLLYNRRVNPPLRRALLDEIAIRDGVRDARVRVRLTEIINEQAAEYLRRKELRLANPPWWRTMFWALSTGVYLFYVVATIINPTPYEISGFTVAPVDLQLGVYSAGVVLGGRRLYAEIRHRLRSRRLHRRPSTPGDDSVHNR